MAMYSSDNRHFAERSIFSRIKALVLNIIFYPVISVWILLGIIAFPFCLVLWKVVTRWDVGMIVRHLINIHAYVLLIILFPFIPFKGEGFAGIKRPCILVVNHRSFFDSYFISILPFHDIIFAVGAWPFKMYWYTMFMRLAQYLDVETIDWSEVVHTCKKTFAKQGAVLFFPEGHRSKTGKLQCFHSGAFRLAQETGVPIVPLCITGTGTMLPPGHFFLYPSRVRLKVLEPIDPSHYPGTRGADKLRKEVRKLMMLTLEEMQ